MSTPRARPGPPADGRTGATMPGFPGVEYARSVEVGGVTLYLIAETHAVVAREPSGRMAGYISWGDAAIIGNANVLPEYQRRGLGTAMLGLAREVEPQLAHSATLSDAARGWSERAGHPAAPTRYWHGTFAQLKPGDVIVPGAQAGRCSANTPKTDVVYVSTDRSQAAAFAAYSAHELGDGGRGWIYPVEPLGEVRRDPYFAHRSYVTASAKVLEAGLEVPGWDEAGYTASSDLVIREAPEHPGLVDAVEPGWRCVVAEVDGQEIGSLFWFGGGRINSVYVEEAYRRQGVATRMLSKARAVDPGGALHNPGHQTPAGKAWAAQAQAAHAPTLPADG